jgi:hypothetical protein
MTQATTQTLFLGRVQVLGRSLPLTAARMLQGGKG